MTMSFVPKPFNGPTYADDSGNESADSFVEEPSSDELDNDSDSSFGGKPFNRKKAAPRRSNKQRKPRAKKEPPKPRQKATVLRLAGDLSSDRAHTTVDSRVLDRIKKCKDLATHPNTAEHEARAAFYMMSRLMTAYNIDAVDLNAHTMTAEEKAKQRGSSTVSIELTIPGDGKVYMQTFVEDLERAMTTFFDCEAFSTQHRGAVVWTFYGLMQNTIIAATAFEMAHNLILEWGRGRKRIAANSFFLGAAWGLLQIAEKAKRDEKRAARKREKELLEARIAEERRAEQRQSDRLKPLNEDAAGSYAAPSVAAVEEEHEESHSSLGHDSDDDTASDAGSMTPLGRFGPLGHDQSDDDNGSNEGDDDDGMDSGVEADFNAEDDEPIDLTGDFDADLAKIIKREELESPRLLPTESAVKVEPDIKIEDTEDTKFNTNALSTWQSTQQLVLYKNLTKDASDQWLKDEKIKLTTLRKRERKIRDWGAYIDGKEAAKDIDIKRKRIKLAGEQPVVANNVDFLRNENDSSDDEY